VLKQAKSFQLAALHGQVKYKKHSQAKEKRQLSIFSFTVHLARDAGRRLTSTETTRQTSLPPLNKLDRLMALSTSWKPSLLRPGRYGSKGTILSLTEEDHL
jgi:hypothetical protein